MNPLPARLNGTAKFLYAVVAVVALVALAVVWIEGRENAKDSGSLYVQVFGFGLFALAGIFAALKSADTERAAERAEAAAIAARDEARAASEKTEETHRLVNGQMSAFVAFMEKSRTAEVAAALARGKLEGHVAEQEQPGVAQPSIPPPGSVSPAKPLV